MRIPELMVLLEKPRWSLEDVGNFLGQSIVEVSKLARRRVIRPIPKSRPMQFHPSDVIALDVHAKTRRAG